MTGSTITLDPESILGKSPFQNKDAVDTAEHLAQKIAYQTNREGRIYASDKRPSQSNKSKTQRHIQVLQYGSDQILKYLEAVSEQKSTSLERDAKIEHLLRGSRRGTYQSLLLSSYVSSSLMFLQIFLATQNFKQGEHTTSKESGSAHIIMPFQKEGEDIEVSFFFNADHLFFELSLAKRNPILSDIFLYTVTTLDKILNASIQKQYIPDRITSDFNINFK